MNFDTETLRKKIEYYFSGNMSRQDLGEWANNAYYDILRGSYVEIKKIQVYPFLKKISTFHIAENDKKDEFPCSEKSVKEVQDILDGKINFNFDVETSIPIQVYTMYKEKQYYDNPKRDFFVKLRSEIFQYFEQGCRASNEIELLLKKLMYLDYNRETIQDMLAENIFLLLKVLFKTYFTDQCNEIKENLKIYAQKSEDNLLIKRLFGYLDSYTGNRNFHLLISFKKGNPDISILV